MLELAVKLNKKGLSFEQLCDDPQVQAHFYKAILAACKEMNFTKKEIPARIYLCKEEWTADSGLLTAAMKMKRMQVNAFYREQVKQMFDQINATETSKSL